ncbi:MAG: MerR family transcriptional regulator [Xanthobacteraceae bacterium]|nr:MerR family transcriptional regulator [Xanthobacteraceae bacterium]
MDKAPDAFRTISEVADDLDIPQHVLRFWETRFSQIKPMKRSGGRRYYRPDDVDLLRGIRRLLYGEGYTIRGVQRILREQGLKSVQALADESITPPSPARRADPADHTGHPDHDEDAVALAGETGFDEDVETDEDGLEVASAAAPPQPRAIGAGTNVRALAEERDAAIRPAALRAATPAVAAPARGLSPSDAARLKAALDDLTACKKLVDDALKAIPPDLFPLK